MKIKNIFKYLVVASLVVQLTACTSTEVEQKFDKTPTERLNMQKSELQQALLSSPEGWKAVYFTDDKQLGGFTHLFKFTADGKVEMASDFDATTTSKFTSEYDIQLGSTVSLVFTTKNRIHLLSDSSPASNPTPALLGKGYLGDFQFLYYGEENGQLIFKANRTAGDSTSKEIRFVKATAQDWTDLPKNIDMIANVVGANTRPLFRLFETNDGKTVHQYDFTFTTRSRFSTANSIEPGSTATNNMGIAYTPTGIIVSPAVEVGGQKLTEFVYNSADGSFTATGANGVSATIRYSSKPLVLTDDYKSLVEGKPQMVFGYIAANLYTAPTNSSYFKTLVDKVNTTLPANQSIARVQIVFNNVPNGTYIQYQFNGGKAQIIHWLTTKEDAVNKTIILVDDGWNTTTANYNFLKEIDNELTNAKGLYVKKENFRITYSNTIYTFTSAASNFRMTTYQL
ncbi:MAG: DUF4302 domain-containing protein [Flavobacterium sp.]|uniref:DUF4302 domain-containing protein n=1 Tax=Flavobacterium sp. TaxID=239 RepID=UPI001B22274C|nr:DUF4302 domain-containing protein [Flavobacterium sp.]MBO9584700.1 DUF4302 domain-containing protein [Flavobacterium sp.]